MRFYNASNQTATAKVQTLGDTLKIARKSKNLSLAQLSSKTGVSSSYLHRIESNQRKNVTLKLLLKISDVLEIPANLILSLHDCKYNDFDNTLIFPTPGMEGYKQKLLSSLIENIINTDTSYIDALDLAIKVLKEFK